MGPIIFLTNFKSNASPRASAFRANLDRCTAEERRTFDDIVFLTRTRSAEKLMWPGRLVPKVGVLLSLEDANFSVRFLLSFVGPAGTTGGLRLQTLPTVSLRTGQPVCGATLLRQYGHLLRERLCTPNFEKHACSPRHFVDFSGHVVQTGMRVAQSIGQRASCALGRECQVGSRLCIRLAKNGLNGTAFLFPGTGSVDGRASRALRHR